MVLVCSSSHSIARWRDSCMFILVIVLSVLKPHAVVCYIFSRYFAWFNFSYLEMACTTTANIKRDRLKLKQTFLYITIYIHCVVHVCLDPFLVLTFTVLYMQLDCFPYCVDGRLLGINITPIPFLFVKFHCWVLCFCLSAVKYKHIFLVMK